AHMMSVPFENLDIPLGQKIRLNGEALLNKVVNNRRGGFCYELNYTFSWLLSELGFKVSLLGAQVFGDDQYGLELDHMLLLVAVEDGVSVEAEVDFQNSQWIADVGFGDSFVESLPLNGAKQNQQTQMGNEYQLVEQGPCVELQRKKPNGAWQAQYKFGLNAFEFSDFEAMCHYQQTSPESSFSRKSVCSMITPQGRKTISNGRFIDSSGAERTELPITTPSQYRQVLQQHFNLSLPQEVSLEKLCSASMSVSGDNV
ncbi:MAG: arylamine N-acetyltransferase, partial [Algicola sp.]|nr:arylamine N-acetyltransferase [Algicola sp.]